LTEKVFHRPTPVEAFTASLRCPKAKMSILSTFQGQLFPNKSIIRSFSILTVSVRIFFRKEIGKKGARKMSVKLTK